MTDPGAHVVVREWTDVDGAPDLIDGIDKQRVAAILTEQAWNYIVWIPEWLLEDEQKDIETVEASDHLAVGDVTDYSDKAWNFIQPHRSSSSPIGAPGGYLPKSQVVVFERGPGLEVLETPQQGLTDFAGVADG